MVWNTSLSAQNIEDLERIQKTAVKIIIKQRNLTYTKALQLLELETLHERRYFLNVNFARKSLQNKSLSDMFVQNKKIHKMTTRNPDKFDVHKSHTERLKMSAIPQMQRMLNIVHT